MRVLIVDGHSMIFAWPEVRKLHDKRSALARETLVRMLTEYQDFSGVHTVAVFDGRGEKMSEATEPAGIQIFYSGSGQTADDIVERLVARYAREHEITVATGDLAEQQTAISFGADVMSAESLRELLEQSRAELDRRLKNQRR